MAFTFGFYNSIDEDRLYDAVQVSQIFDGIISDGVYAQYKNAMILKVNSEGQVYVQPGRAWLDHTWNYVDSDTIVEGMPESDVVHPRIDAIVIDIQANIEQRTNSIIWVKGTAAANPVKPAMINTYYHHQYPLGFITRKANTTTVGQADIENAVGTSALPFVTGILDTVDIDELILQWKAQWDDFMKYKTFEVTEWFNNLKDFLDENAEVKLTQAVMEVTKNEFEHYYGLVERSTTIDSKTKVIVSISDEATITTKIGDKGNDGTRQIIETIKVNQNGREYTKKTTITPTDSGVDISESYSYKID